MFKTRPFYSVLFLFGALLSLQGQTEIVEEIDAVVEDAIQQKAFPGGQLLIAKSGRIVYHKAYGYHTYDSLQKVSLEDVYDLASMTKVLASTLSFMKLYEDQGIDLDRPLKQDIRTLKGRKGKTTYREILAHQAGWIPYIAHQYKVVKKNGTYRSRTLSASLSDNYPLQLNDSLFIHKKYPQKILRRIRRTPVKNRGTYRYSGLWFFLLPSLIEKHYQMPFDRFLEVHFYNPLQADRLGFTPSKQFSTEKIVPTEIDTLMRKSLVKGYVHDEAAALMGGVSGNAGLFGNAGSVYKVAELFQQNGTVNGVSYLNASTIERFTSKAYPGTENRRGLGFDKPDLSDPEDPYPSALISENAYGHTGFTGTAFWIDPDNKMVFILLTNRVYPSRTQQGFYAMNIREQLLDLAIQL